MFLDQTRQLDRRVHQQEGQRAQVRGACEDDLQHLARRIPLGQEDFFDAGPPHVSQLPGGGSGVRIGLSTHEPSDEYVEAAYNSDDDEYLVVWHAGGRIVGQRLDHMGTPRGDVLQIGAPTTDRKYKPAAAWSTMSTRPSRVFWSPLTRMW